MTFLAWGEGRILKHCQSSRSYGTGSLKKWIQAVSIRHFDGCQSALWDCFGDRICRHVENASPKTVPQCTLTTISTRSRSPAQPQSGEYLSHFFLQFVKLLVNFSEIIFILKDCSFEESEPYGAEEKGKKIKNYQRSLQALLSFPFTSTTRLLSCRVRLSRMWPLKKSTPSQWLFAIHFETAFRLF